MLGLFTAQWNTERPSLSRVWMSAPCLGGTEQVNIPVCKVATLVLPDSFADSPQQCLHTLWLGLERGPEERCEACAVSYVDLCTQVEESITHARLVPEDSVHERSPSSVVLVVNSTLNGLHRHTE